MSASLCWITASILSSARKILDSMVSCVYISSNSPESSSLYGSGRLSRNCRSFCLSSSSSLSVLLNAGISPVKASPMSWKMHMRITLFMSASGNSSFTRYAMSDSLQLCSAMLSWRPEDVHECLVLFFSFSATASISISFLTSTFQSSAKSLSFHRSRVYRVYSQCRNYSSLT